MTFQTSTKPQAIAARLIELVSERDFVPGARLPTEKVLMQTLQVGRSSLREAMRKLEAMGIVRVRHGTGTFLQRRPGRSEVLVPLAVDDGAESLLQALDVRRALESHAAALAARTASPAQLDQIRAALEEMEQVHIRTGSATAEDLRFHLAIYRAANNPLFERIIGPVSGPLHLFFARPADAPPFGNGSFALHRALYEAIIARDAEAARRVTLALLDRVEAGIRALAVPSD